jgi:uncharacterized protein (TIGR02996 family)
MDLEEGFLNAICLQPREWTPRLVYADWLDERGAPGDAARAELLRLQWAWAKTRVGSGRRAELEGRAREVLRQNRGVVGRLPRVFRALPPLSLKAALPAFLYGTGPARPDPGPLPAGSAWQGVLHQGDRRIPTTMTVTKRDGPRVRGRLDEDFASLHGPGSFGRFSLEGVFAGGRLLTFVTGKISGPVAVPGLYVAWLGDDQLQGTWQVVWSEYVLLAGTFELARTRDDRSGSTWHVEGAEGRAGRRSPRRQSRRGGPARDGAASPPG